MFVFIVIFDDAIFELRVIKSENEIACLKEAMRITRITMDEVIKNIKPGMTELQVVGIALGTMYANGAEYEGLPQYVLSGESSGHAISRASHRILKKGDLVQLNLSARVSGYSPSIGCPVYLGKMPDEMRKLIEFGLEAHHKTIEFMKAGIPAKEVVLKYEEYVEKRGFKKYMLYGPCHGLGMIEVERPWMEATSTYDLQENMTFQVDTFFYTEHYGLRWENAARIKKDGVELLSPKLTHPIEIN